MAITRAPRPTGNFYILDKKISEDKRLSWAARGLLIFLLGKPDNWTVSPAALVNETQDAYKSTGRDAVYGLLKELQTSGYLKIFGTRKAGAFAGNDYVVDESSLPNEINHLSPHPENPHTAKPDTAKPTLLRTELKKGLNVKRTHTAKPKSSKPCAVNNTSKTAVCVSSSKLPKQPKSEQPSPVNSPKPTTPLEVTLQNLETVLAASGIEASAATKADAVAITLTKGKALDYAVGTVKRKLASGEAATPTFSAAPTTTVPSSQPVYVHPEVVVASEETRLIAKMAREALTGKPAPTAPDAAPNAENAAFTPLVSEFKWAVDIITQKRKEAEDKVTTSKIGNRAFTSACEVLRVNKKTLNQE